MDALEVAAAFRHTVARYHLIAPGNTVVVGVSGGADSLTLLHLLAGVRDEWNLTLIAAHLHHGIRGAEADNDAEFVSAICRQWSIEVVSERADVPAIRQRRHQSMQHAAREVRHAFLRGVAGVHQADHIALAHHADDRIETVLLNIVRGTGTDGLRGLAPREGQIVRPLYDVRRADIETYCQAHALPTRTDSSNADLHYARNRVRAELLPYLVSYYNQKADDALLRLSDLAGEDSDALEQMAARALTDVQASETPQRLTLSLSRLRQFPLALQRRVVRQAIAQVRGSLVGITYDHVAHVLMPVPTGYGLPAFEGVLFSLQTEGDSLHVIRQETSRSDLPWQVVLQMGENRLPAAGLQITVQKYDMGASIKTAQQERDFASQQVGWFALERIALPLRVRSWQAGDRLALDDNTTKKVQDIFTDAHIPRLERSRIPLIVEASGGERVLMVGGVRVAGGDVRACMETTGGTTRLLENALRVACAPL